MIVKIEAQKLKNYLDVITVKGRVMEILLKFSEEGIESNIILEGNIGATFSLLKKSSFSEYNTDVMEVGIKDSILMISILNSFEGVVSLEIENNIMKVFNENKVAHIITIKKEFINTIFPEESKKQLLEKFDKGILTSINIFRNAAMNSGILKSDTFILKNLDNAFSITTGENNFDKIKENTLLDYRDFESKYDAIFGNVVSVLTDNINFTIMGNDSPCMFTLINENYDCKIMIAPLAKEE